MFLKFRKFHMGNTCVGVLGLEACNFIKKILQHSYFPVELVKFLRTPFNRTTAVAASEHWSLISQREISFHSSLSLIRMRTPNRIQTAREHKSKQNSPFFYFVFFSQSFSFIQNSNLN